MHAGQAIQFSGDSCMGWMSPSVEETCLVNKQPPRLVSEQIHMSGERTTNW